MSMINQNYESWAEKLLTEAVLSGTNHSQKTNGKKLTALDTNQGPNVPRIDINNQ
jgi:hypothetical protein